MSDIKEIFFKLNIGQKFKFNDTVFIKTNNNKTYGRKLSMCKPNCKNTENDHECVISDYAEVKVLFEQMELNYISIQKGLSQCQSNGAHLTSAALENGEYISYEVDDGFYLDKEFIGKSIFTAMNYLQNQKWAMDAKWYIKQDVTK